MKEEKEKKLMKELIEAQHEKRNANRNAHDKEESSKGFVLRYLENAEDEVNPTKICKAMNVTTPRITNILNELEKEGFIERNISKTDRRRISVILTEEGKAEIREHKEKQEKYLSKLIEKIGPDDTKAYIRILKAEAELARKS